MDSVAKIQQPNRDGCQISIYNLSYIRIWEMESVQMKERKSLTKYAFNVKSLNQDNNTSIS